MTLLETIKSIRCAHFVNIIYCQCIIMLNMVLSLPDTLVRYGKANLILKVGTEDQDR